MPVAAAPPRLPRRRRRDSEEQGPGPGFVPLLPFRSDFQVSPYSPSLTSRLYLAHDRPLAFGRPDSEARGTRARLRPKAASESGSDPAAAAEIAQAVQVTAYRPTTPIDSVGARAGAVAVSQHPHSPLVDTDCRVPPRPGRAKPRRQGPDSNAPSNRPSPRHLYFKSNFIYSDVSKCSSTL